MTKPVKIQQPAWIATLGLKTNPEVVNETDTGTYIDSKDRE